MSYLLIFYCNIGYLNAPMIYIVRTVPVLFEFDHVALPAIMGCGANVFSSIG